MTKIKLNRDLGGHKAGDTIDVTPKTAVYLTEQGHADDTKPVKKTAVKADTED